MKPEQLIGEATEYDKKAMLEAKKTKELVEKCKCFCQWCWWCAYFRHC